MAACSFSSRRGFLGGAGSALAASALVRPAAAHGADGVAPAADSNDAIPFHGFHQGGIETPHQRHIVFASFDLVAEQLSDVTGLLRDWTEAAVRLTRGNAFGLGPRRLTLTFGFGPGMFEKNGHDRYGLKARRPAPLVDLPRFAGDQLDPAQTEGDLCI